MFIIESSIPGYSSQQHYRYKDTATYVQSCPILYKQYSCTRMHSVSVLQFKKILITIESFISQGRASRSYPGLPSSIFCEKNDIDVHQIFKALSMLKMNDEKRYFVIDIRYYCKLRQVYRIFKDGKYYIPEVSKYRGAL